MGFLCPYVRMRASTHWCVWKQGCVPKCISAVRVYLFIYVCIHSCLFYVCFCSVYNEITIGSECLFFCTFRFFFLCGCTMLTYLKALSWSMIKSTSPLSYQKCIGHPLSNTERTGLCNLHDVASAFGMIYITYAYKAVIDRARHGLLGWIMGL